MLNPERMEELKEKYGITDEAIFEIADSLEGEIPDETPLPIMGKQQRPRGVPQPFMGPQPQQSSFGAIQAALKGEVSIGEALLLTDYMDRKNERELRRNRDTRPTPDASMIKELIQEIREERRSFEDRMERLILGRRVEDAEERARKAEEEKMELQRSIIQRDEVEKAIKATINELLPVYDKRIESLATAIDKMNPQQQRGFWDEVLQDFEGEIKEQVKSSIMTRLKPPKEPLTKKDDSGKRSLNVEGIIDRAFELGDKFLETRKEKPPKIRVKEAPVERGQPLPLSEGTPEAPVETEPQEVPAEPQPAPEPEITVTPIPPQNIAGIGPSRAAELESMGITDARQLAKVSPGHLSDQLSISKDKAEDMVKQAKDLTDQA